MGLGRKCLGGMIYEAVTIKFKVWGGVLLLLDDLLLSFGIQEKKLKARMLSEVYCMVRYITAIGVHGVYFSCHAGMLSCVVL